MTFSEDLLTGVCQAIAGYADKQQPYEYKTGTDVYSDGAAAVVWGVSTDMDTQIVVALYAVEDDQSLSESVIGVNFRVSGPPNMQFVNDACDDLFDLFHGLYSTTLGSVKVVQAEHRSGAPLRQDDSERVSRSENYYFTVHRPSNNRT